MNRVLRLFLATAGLVGAISATQLSLPGNAAACTCRAADPEDIGAFGDDPNAVVFIGTVTRLTGQMNQAGHTFADLVIVRVFKGTLPPVVLARGGGGFDCTMSLARGQHMITVAEFSGGSMTFGACRPYADPATAEGRAMVAAAERAYGLGAIIDPVPVTGPPFVPVPDRSGALPIVIGGVVGVVVLLFGAIAVLARRKRPAA